MRVCVHIRVHVCMHGTPPHTPMPTPTPIHHPPQGVDPRNHLKFDNTSIPFEDLKSVKNSSPMGGCVVWWVGGWLGGLMGGVRSNH